MLSGPLRDPLKRWLATLLVVGVACSSPSKSDSRDSSIVPTSDASTTTLLVAANSAAVSSSSSSTTPVDQASIDFSLIDPLVEAVANNSKVGASTLSLEDVVRLSPRASLDGFFDGGGMIVVGLPLESTCAWFVGSATGEIALGESDGAACDPSGDVPSLSIDGSGIAWALDALEKIDTVAQLNALAVMEEIKTAILVDKSSPGRSEIQAALPGLRLVEGDQASALAREVSVELEGPAAAIAVRGQSGLCYLISAQISSNATITYGTGDVCSATAAASGATEADWP